MQRLASLEKAAEARHAGMKIYVEDTRALAALAEQVGGEGGKGQFRLVLRLGDSPRKSSSCCRRASTPPPSSGAR